MGQVSVDEARQLVAKHEVEVIDLRDEDDWVDGHIPGAHRAGDDVESRLEDLGDDRKLLIVCADGKRSAEVADELGSDDREAVSLKGGMDSWQSEGMPSQPAADYEPGPAPVEGEDSEQAAEVAEGKIDPDEDPDDDEESEESEESGSGESEHEADASLEEPQEKAEDEAGEPVEGASGDAPSQQERT